MRLVPIILVLTTVALLAPAARAGELRNFEDAALHDVQFVDASVGWAVGDEGVIWNTIDGGRHWERQPSGVRGSLRSLHFLDPYVGWVAGREELPEGGSAGILLHTRDGGVRWQRVLLNALPGFNRVRFADTQTGYLAGDGSGQYPTGVFLTHDGGHTWQPVPGPRCPSWLGADFGPDGGALGGAWNRLATVRRGRVYMADMDILGGRSLRGVQLRGSGGVAVGQGGLVLVSEGTRGSSWGFPDGLKLPREVRSDWDFHAVHGVGRHVWVVGRPGSAALHSPDDGRTWEVVPTGQALPLNGLFFRDEQHGWAVGELGCVVATEDGGKTWKVQRRGGQRAAVLFVHARAAGAPLDTVAVLGGDQGYLAAGLRVTAPDPASASLSPTGEDPRKSVAERREERLREADLSRANEGPRFAAAWRQAGGAAGEMLWQFPLGSHLAASGREDLIRAWDQLHAGRAADHLLRQIVLALRTWRPEVVITDPSDCGSRIADRGFSGNPQSEACDALVAEAVREAFRRAGDARAFPEQLEVLRLEPWNAAKLYARRDGAKSGGVRMDLTAIRARLESTAQEFAAGPQALLAGAAVALPGERYYRLLAARRAGAAGDRDLMDGIDLAPGGLARRDLPAVEGLPEELLKAVRQRTYLRVLSETPANQLTDPNRLLSQIGPMLGDMPDDQAAPAAYAVAQQYVRLGQWGLAREAFLLVVDRYPAHPLARDACRWLLRHSSSSEARRRFELGQFVVAQQTQFGTPSERGSRVYEDRGSRIEGNKAPPAGSGKSKGRAAQKKPPKGLDPRRPEILVDPSRPEMPEVPRFEARPEENLLLIMGGGKDLIRSWYRGSLEMEGRLAAFGPLFTGDPSVQFCLQAARRNLGDFETAHQWYSQFAARQPDGPWRSAALAELWLARRSGPPPKPVLHCRPADARPFLDGKLDDACWQGGPAVRLRNAAGKTAEECPTEVRLAYDRDYLYLAVRCARPADRRVEPAKVRGRDGDLRGQDRVSLVLDLDRDYATCYHLQIDQRGFVSEDCWGDKSWDPRWFVAVRSEAEAWVAEAAIPMTALTGDGITPGRAWAVNVVRALPGRGVQAFALPAEVPEVSLRPEGMGLLLFTQAPNQQAAAGLMPPSR